MQNGLEQTDGNTRVVIGIGEALLTKRTGFTVEGLGVETDQEGQIAVKGQLLSKSLASV